jgi:cobalt-zinc-cadmium efflux system membrane fusion protein
MRSAALMALPGALHYAGLSLKPSALHRRARLPSGWRRRRLPVEGIMNDSAIRSHSPAPSPAPPPRTPNGVLSWIRTVLPTFLALALLGGVGFWGWWTDWKLPKFASLLSGKDEDETDEEEEDKDWCEKHGAPKESCVECKPELFPRPKSYGWCKTHGVHECPLDHPDVAQLSALPLITAEEKKRVLRALKFGPRTKNDDDCKLHTRCIQLKSWELMEKAGIRTAQVTTKEMVESVTAPGELSYDPTLVARISARVPGTVRRVFKRIGQKVERGEVVALIESADVSRARADFLQAAAQFNLRSKTLARMKMELSSFPAARVLEAETAVQEAKIRVLGAEQALVSLGLPVHAADCAGLEPEELTRRVAVLGLPPEVVRTLDNKLTTTNLLPVISPRAGEVVDRQAVVGQVIDTRQVLLTVADTRRLWLLLHVRQEEGGRLQVGQPIDFQPDTGAKSIPTRIAWISPEVDPKTRTILIRAEVANEKGEQRANTFGEGTITQRVEKHAVVVPSNAVHSDGNCQVVFVLDKRSRQDKKGPLVFHVRSVRIGVRGNQDTEIIVGVLPGEWVATEGSAALRGQLLKDSMGGD